MKKILVFLGILMAVSTYSQIYVVHLADVKDFEEMNGFVYALPETEVVITVKVQKTEHFKGPYADYAAKYLNTSDIIKHDHSTYQIIDVTMDTRSIPDPEHYYFVQFPGMKKEVFRFNLNEKGFLTDISRLGTKKQLKKAFKKYMQNTFDESAVFEFLSSSNLVEVTDTVIRKVVVDTITVTKRYFEKKWALKGSEQKAREAAKMIQQIKEARYNLLTGYQEVAYDGQAIAYMDSELQRMEKEYLAMFTGATVVKEFTYQFSVVPKDTDEDMIPVFTFSERTGLHYASSKLGETIYLEIVQAANPEYDSFEDISGVEGQGIAYRVPLTMNLTLEVDEDLTVQGQYVFPQLGQVLRLPVDVLTVSLDEETGSLKSVLFK